MTGLSTIDGKTPPTEVFVAGESKPQVRSVLLRRKLLLPVHQPIN
ncbi:hypothetical protein ACU8KH_06606 [Lachancea thermotolerans]